MVKVTVCIGSSCHIKGSRFVVDQLRSLIEQNGLQEKVELKGAFCVSKCQQGVCTTVNGELYSVSPETVEEFFKNEILTRV